VRIARLALDTIIRRSYEARWFWSADGAAFVKRRYEEVQPDLVVFAHLFMASYVAFESWSVPVVFDTHNYEQGRLRSVARGDGAFRMRLVNSLQVGPTSRFERRVVQASSLVVACRESDADAFQRLGARNVVVIPNGTNIPPVCKAARSELLFLGSFTYQANRDAFSFLCDEVLPLIRRDVVLNVVGSGAQPRLRPPDTIGRVRIRWVGEVHDVGPFLDSALALVAPLRQGGGTKLKVIEAMAHGTPVITTSVGAEGLAVADGDELLIAEGAAEFASRVDELLDEPALRARLSRLGRRFVLKNHTWSDIGDRYAAALSDLTTQAGDV